MNEITDTEDMHALMRRIETAVFDAKVDRFAVEFDWPECHKPRCQAHHNGSTARALGIMQAQILDNIRIEVLAEGVTRPDVSDEDTDGRPDLLAIYTLAGLLRMYFDQKGQWLAVAERLVETHPRLAEAIYDPRGDER